MYVEEDRVTFVKKTPAEEDHTDTEKQPILARVLYILLLLSSLFIQTSSAATAELPIVTIIIVPKSVTITTTQSIELPARIIPALTLSESKTIPTTGKGHQSPTYAHGYITFYNGLFTSQTVASGTILAASNGVQIETDQLAIIPAAIPTTPPTYGHVTVSAHAIQPGSQGNIAVGDINTACCLPSVLAQNTSPFHGGQNERFFRMVSQNDIDGVSQPLTKTLMKGIQGAFTGQLTTTEALIPPPCSENIMPDHKPGAEATTVTVTVSETCSAGAYDKASMQEKARQLVTTAAIKQLGAGYNLLGDVQYQLVQATMQKGRAILHITCSGIWMYQLTSNEQQRLLHLIAGKSKQAAINTLLSVPGIQQVTITGIAENAIIPTDTNHIHILLVYREV